MKKQITNISIHQSSLILALLQTIISFIFIAIPVFIIDLVHKKWGLGITELIVLPILYFVFTYIVLAVTFFFYNFIAKHRGGIEIEVTEK